MNQSTHNSESAARLAETSNAHIASGDIDGAIDCLRKALEENPSPAGWHIRLARLLIEKGSREEAITAYMEGIKLNDQQAVWHIQLGKVLAYEGRVADAIESFSRGLTLDDTHGRWWVQLANVLWENNDAQQAIEAVKKAIELDPRQASWFALLGKYLAKVGQISGAASNYREAVNIGGGPAVWKAELEALERTSRIGAVGLDIHRGKQWYDTVYQESDNYRVHYKESVYVKVWGRIVELLTDRHPDSILEIGCGSGQLGCALRDNLPATNYLGFDFSEEAIRIAQTACPKCRFVVADILSTDLLINHDYDTVVCTEVLEHINEDMEAIRRVMPDRYFIGTVPDFDSISHVRYFSGTEEVETRYSSVISDIQVESIRLEGGGHLFLFYGVRK